MRAADLWDLLYPTVEPLSEEEQDHQIQGQQEQLHLVETHTDPEALVKGYAELCTEEAERLKSVEERLSGVLGLTSITANLLIGGIFTIVDDGLSDSSGILDATDVTCQAQKSRRLFVAGSISWIIGGL